MSNIFWDLRALNAWINLKSVLSTIFDELLLFPARFSVSLFNYGAKWIDFGGWYKRQKHVAESGNQCIKN